jgi:hypothetical protein
MHVGKELDFLFKQKSTGLNPDFEVPSCEKNYGINIRIEGANVKGVMPGSGIFSPTRRRFDLDRGIRAEI